MTHALIYNPHQVVRWHRELKTPGLVDASYNALIGLALEVGAMDMFSEPAPHPAPAAPASSALPPPTGQGSV